MQLTPEMARFASPAQKEYLEAYLDHGGNVRAAARACGKHHKTVQLALERVRQKAQLQGYSPEHGIDFPVPDLFFMEKLTLNTDQDGKIKQAWPKLKLDDLKWQNFVQERRERFLDDNPVPALPFIPKPAHSFNPWVIPWYNIGDAHLNMLAHHQSTGRGFNLQDAADELLAAFDIFMTETQPSERAVINDLGDFTHHENVAGLTSQSGNLLDCDQPYGTMIDVASSTMERIIHRALEVHNHVDVIINQGNHSRVNDLWMAVYLRSVFRDNPRVNILDNNRVFIPYRMDDVFVMCHHSDRCPPARLMDVMYNDYNQDAAEAKFRYIWTGHVHHKMRTKEYGAEIESFNNLAPNDKHHFDAGYRSKNSITRVDLHRRYGEVGRRVLPLEEIHARMTYAPSAFQPEVFRV